MEGNVAPNLVTACLVESLTHLKWGRIKMQADRPLRVGHISDAVEANGIWKTTAIVNNTNASFLWAKKQLSNEKCDLDFDLSKTSTSFLPEDVSFFTIQCIIMGYYDDILTLLSQ